MEEKYSLAILGALKRQKRELPEEITRRIFSQVMGPSIFRFIGYPGEPIEETSQTIRINPEDRVGDVYRRIVKAQKPYWNVVEFRSDVSPEINHLQAKAKPGIYSATFRVLESSLTPNGHYGIFMKNRGTTDSVLVTRRPHHYYNAPSDIVSLMDPFTSNLFRTVEIPVNIQSVFTGTNLFGIQNANVRSNVLFYDLNLDFIDEYYLGSDNPQQITMSDSDSTVGWLDDGFFVLDLETDLVSQINTEPPQFLDYSNNHWIVTLQRRVQILSAEDYEIISEYDFEEDILQVSVGLNVVVVLLRVNMISVWNYATGRVTDLLTENNIDYVTVCPFGQTIALLTHLEMSNQIELMNISTFEIFLIMTKPDGVNTVTFSPNGASLISDNGLSWPVRPVKSMDRFHVMKI